MQSHLKLARLAPCLVLAAAGAAHAQSSVNIYGLIDLPVEHLDGVGAGRARLTRMPANTGTIASRLGFRGTEDLGGGLGAVFTLEMGLNPDSGSLGQGGRAFGRQSFVGLTGPWGTVAFGRQYTMMFYSQLDADLLAPNIYGTGSLDSYLPNARADNALGYKGTFGGFTLGATYSLGRDTVNAGPSPAGTNCPGESASDPQACREASLLLKYDAANWGAALAHDTLRGRTLGAAPDAVLPAGLNSSAKSDTRLHANGYVKFGAAKLGLGLIRRDNDGDAAKPRSNLAYVGLSYPVTPQLTLDGQLLSLRYRGASAFKSDLVALRALYSLSRRTTLYAQVGHIRNGASATVSVSGGQPGSNTAPGGSQTGVAFGLRHTF